MKCDAPGCDRPVSRRGMCGMHYQRWMKYQSYDLPVKDRITGIPCSVDGCGKKAVGRGLCHAHYKRLMRGEAPGTREVRRTPGATPVCEFPDCGRKHSSHGLCAPHRVQQKKGVELQPIRVVDTPSTYRDDHGRKLCNKCDTFFPENDFHKTAGAVDGLSHWCRDCSRVAPYGMNRVEYCEMLEAQGSGCAICGGVNKNGRSLAVDHDHACCSGNKSCGHCVRGLLCDPCNMSIGSMNDSPARLRAAADYLEGIRR